MSFQGGRGPDEEGEMERHHLQQQPQEGYPAPGSVPPDAAAYYAPAPHFARYGGAPPPMNQMGAPPVDHPNHPAAGYGPESAAAAARMYGHHPDQQPPQRPYPPPPPGYPYHPHMGMHHIDPRYHEAMAQYPGQHPYHGHEGQDQGRGPEAPPPGYHSMGYGYPPPHARLPPPKDGSSPVKKEKADGDTSSPGVAQSPDGSGMDTPSPQSSALTRRPNNGPHYRQVGNTIVDEHGEQQWYTGCVPLGLADDKYWLSELQVYLRSNFAEAFAATEDDIAAPMHGRNKPIILGQVGIRCMYSKNVDPAERGQQSTSYPSQISGIYNSVQQMLRLHLDCCQAIPPQVRGRIEQLRASCSSRGGRKQYWVDSAKRLGLVDTPNGIFFGRDPNGPLPPLSGPSINYKESRKKKLEAKAEAEKKREDKKAAKQQAQAKEAATQASQHERPTQPPLDARPLVYPEDKPLIADYLYLTLEQFAPCTLMEADRVGCYKDREVGFPGIACKHGVGQAGCGRYFPASEASLSQTTTSQTIMNYVRNCRHVPIEIRESLEIMKRNRMGPDGKRADKPKHGGRKVFFHRLWCRIHGLPIEEGKGEHKESKKKKLYKKPGPVPQKKKSGEDSDTDTEEEDNGHVEGEEEDSKPKAKVQKGPVPMAKRKAMSPWYEGAVLLSKSDDQHWLTEMECFSRSDLVEVFSLKKNDVLAGYTGGKEPALGQVGIRCVFSKHVDANERVSGCVAFPDMLSSIPTIVNDMIQNYFPDCPYLPDEVRQKFEKINEDEAKEPKSENPNAQQYWVDAARDIGLANIPPDGIGSPGSWGVTFRRDPLLPSPADQLDVGEEEWNKNLLVRPSDRGLCTDYVLLMMQQVRPCRFRKSDRRAGPGSRGRDRVMGFPGLASIHDANKNSLGRYFPVTAKNLTDNTSNSLQAHIAACSKVPEPIQASLAYLNHRASLQKAELSGSWKKAFFQKVWDRLHTERDWTPLEDEIPEADEDYDSGNDEEGGKYAQADNEAAEDDDEDAKEEEGGEKEEVGDQMNALIKAAAIWLTEQDQDKDPKGKKSSKGRQLPAKRAPAESDSGSRSGRGSAGKRRRSG
eukprot:CAMPEP_0168763296 /NCGR_PEP_ID=MMETSP0724-20121128/24284_1 /TAXON_ID=265536 /ORGANISM="Amphiprora sp., Strain CCMP467" /LENGTH=1085 /DNA_ID=CAMNT_0008812483 /DNA_START=241 /DNA_END=3498 /DNA_ORIENTATION=-